MNANNTNTANTVNNAIETAIINAQSAVQAAKEQLATVNANTAKTVQAAAKTFEAAKVAKEKLPALQNAVQAAKVNLTKAEKSGKQKNVDEATAKLNAATETATETAKIASTYFQSFAALNAAKETANRLEKEAQNAVLEAQKTLETVTAAKAVADTEFSVSEYTSPLTVYKTEKDEVSGARVHTFAATPETNGFVLYTNGAAYHVNGTEYAVTVSSDNKTTYYAALAAWIKLTTYLHRLTVGTTALQSYNATIRGKINGQIKAVEMYVNGQKLGRWDTDNSDYSNIGLVPRLTTGALTKKQLRAHAAASFAAFCNRTHAVHVLNYLSQLTANE